MNKLGLSTSQQGFSLIEILVAFSILALALGILLSIFSSGVQTAIIAEEYTIAVQIAESLMAKTGVEEELQEDVVTGIEDEKYRWEVATNLFQGNGGDEEDENPDAYVPFQIIVKVSWGENEDKQRFIELNTLRFASSS